MTIWLWVRNEDILNFQMEATVQPEKGSGIFSRRNIYRSSINLLP